MPMTSIEAPILTQFFCAVASTTTTTLSPTTSSDSNMVTATRTASASSHTQEEDGEGSQKGQKLPKGVVLGPDGKPCRSCTSFAAWSAMTRAQKQQSKSTPTTTTPTITSSLQPTTTNNETDCPPDVALLGRGTWTLLHSIAASYPKTPSTQTQAATAQFMRTLSTLYPCWTCGSDFAAWMDDASSPNPPRVSSRAELGRWLCEAHNAVNVKLGKERFDCDRWEERWRTGWRDGRCD